MTFEISTEGHYHFIDLTDRVAEAVAASGIARGVAVTFVGGSTAAITTMEHEQGLLEDLAVLFESWAPEEGDYRHHAKWGDKNGAAHMKAAVLGPSVAVPFEDGKLLLGEWQHVVLVDFDEKPRMRKISVMITEAV